MVMSSVGLRPKSDYSGKAQKQLSKLRVQTQLLIREAALHQETCNRQAENKRLVMGSRWEPDTKTDWPTNRQS
jgi:hypothetical protein